MSKFYVGHMVEFKDRAGNKVKYFERVRRNYSPAVYANMASASRIRNKMNNDASCADQPDNFVAISIEEYNADPAEYNPQVKTCNILNPAAGFFDISAENFGGCCDPGTETYHSM